MCLQIKVLCYNLFINKIFFNLNIMHKRKIRNLKNKLITKIQNIWIAVFMMSVFLLTWHSDYKVLRMEKDINNDVYAFVK